MDLNRLAQELGFDVETVRGLLNTFVEATTRDLAALEAAVASGDAAEAARLAHHIKGAAAALELEGIAAAALAVEKAAKAGSVAAAGPELAGIRTGLHGLRASP